MQPTPQNDFATQLTNLGTLGNLDARALAATAMQHNRRRLRILAAITIALWLITFLFVPALWMPFAAQMKKLSLELAVNSSNAHPITTQALATILQDALMHIAMVSGIILAIMILAALFAAISTVWLVFTVRRVTFEQLALGLAQISEELKRLQNPRA
jgi:Sec-independent protein secretion pathway component TatC